MLIIILALLIVGGLIGAAGLKQMGRITRRIVGPWRPGVGVTALICLFAAIALSVRGALAEALVLGVFGLVLAVAARRRTPSTPPKAGMGADEARRILGVDPNADRATIEAAYRRLMQRAHPDLGGTSGLAAQLNAARETLKRGT